MGSNHQWNMKGGPPLSLNDRMSQHLEQIEWKVHYHGRRVDLGYWGFFGQAMPVLLTVLSKRKQALFRSWRWIVAKRRAKA